MNLWEINSLPASYLNLCEWKSLEEATDTKIHLIIDSLVNSTGQPRARNAANVAFLATSREHMGAAQIGVESGESSEIESFATKKTSARIQSWQRHYKERNREDGSSRTWHWSKGPTLVSYDVIKVSHNRSLSQCGGREAQARVISCAIIDIHANNTGQSPARNAANVVFQGRL